MLILTPVIFSLYGRCVSTYLVQFVTKEIWRQVVITWHTSKETAGSLQMIKMLVCSFNTYSFRIVFCNSMGWNHQTRNEQIEPKNIKQFFQRRVRQYKTSQSVLLPLLHLLHAQTISWTLTIFLCLMLVKEREGG